WLWGSALAALAGVLAVVCLTRKRLAWRRLAASPLASSLLQVSRSIQFLKAALFVAGALLLAVVLLGPQWGKTTQTDLPPTRGPDVIIILDVSRSMLAEDATPNRLERAKADIRDLTARLEKQGGYRVGLIVFADRAVQLCPLTTDYRCFHEELSRA